MSYRQEWQASCVDLSLISLNVNFFNGSTAYEYLLYSDDLPRRNDGRLRDHILNRYRHIEEGGWWCSGINILTGEADLWGCFKPVKPRRSRDDRKLIKYEHPPREATGIFALRVPLHIWEKIAKRYGVAMPENIVISAEGEAVGFWAWVIAHPKVSLVLTEGAKKAGALLTAGYAAVALPGVNAGYRVPKDEFGNRIGKPRLIPQLLPFATAGRMICLAFDQDEKPVTVTRVRAAVGQTGYLLTRQGCKVSVISWDSEQGLCKGADDLIAQHGSEAFDKAYESALSLEHWKALSYTKLSYTPNIRLNQRYLGSIQIPDNAKLIGIKSAKNTGKTFSLEEVVSEAIAKGQWVLVVSHRVQLAEALCKRFNINYITEVRTSEEGAIFGYGLCIDSLHPESQARFIAENWEDGLVVIDEVEQVLWHGLNSSTCQSDRVPILKSLKTLIQNVLAGDGRVIVADADLSDTSINYLRSLAEVHLDPFIIQNDWKPGAEERWTVTSFGGSNPAGLVRALEIHIKNGGKPFVCVSAQKAKSRWGTLTLERYFRKLFPDLKILRIDSESVSDPKHPAYGCITVLNEVLDKYDMVLASPAVETGVSVDLRGHFTSVWGVAQGVQAENSVRQALARVRENLPRFIWAAPYGVNRVGNGATSVKALLLAQHKLAKANIHQLRAADLEGLDENGNFQSESLVCWAKMAVRVNVGMLRYRESILSALRDEGHVVREFTDLDSDDCDAIKEAVTNCRDEGYQEERAAIEAAENINEKQYKELAEKRAKSPEERRKERKYALKQRYGLPVKSGLIALDDEGWYPQLRLHYYLTLGREHLLDRDRRVAAAQLERGEGDLYKPDFNRSQIGAAVRTLELLGLPKLLSQPDRELRNSDPDLCAIANRLRHDAFAIKAILNITIAERDTPISILKRLLGKVGIGLQYLKRDGTGDRERVYQIVLPADRRDEVFAFWLQRDQERANQPSASTQGNNNGKPVSDTCMDEQLEDIASNLVQGAEYGCLAEVVEAFVGADWWVGVREQVLKRLPTLLKRAVENLLLGCSASEATNKN